MLTCLFMLCCNFSSQVPDGSRGHKVSRRHPVIAQLLPDKEEVPGSKIQCVTVIGTELTQDAAPLIKMPIIPDSEIGQNKFAERKNLKRGHPNVDRRIVTGKSVRQKAKVDTFSLKDMNIEGERRLLGVGFTGNSSSVEKLISQHELLKNTMPLETGGCSYNLAASEHSYTSLDVTSNANDQGGFCGLDRFSSLDNSLLVESIENNNSVENSLRSQTVTSSALPVLPDDGTRNEGFFYEKASIFAQSKSMFPYPEASSAGNSLVNILPGSYFSESFDLGSALSDFKDDLLLINEEEVEEEIVEACDRWNSSEANRIVNEVTFDATSDALVSSDVKRKREMQRKVIYF